MKIIIGKKRFFSCLLTLSAVWFLFTPHFCEGRQQMEVLKYYFGIDTTPRQQWYPHVVYNPVENDFMGVWRTDGVLRVDCEPDDTYECINSFAEITGRRISSEGELLGDLLQWSPPELGFKMIPRISL